jgi:hypothetical protein
MVQTGELSLFIPGTMARRMTRPSPRWALALMIDSGMMSPITRCPDMAYEQMDGESVAIRIVCYITTTVDSILHMGTRYRHNEALTWGSLGAKEFYSYKLK